MVFLSRQGQPFVAPGFNLGRLAASLLIFLTVLLAACGPRSAPLTRPAGAPAPTVPVVFVPGVTGVVLQDSKTHEVAWGLGRNLLRPKDDAYTLALPTVHEDPGLPVLEPVGPIQQIALFGIHKPIYGPIEKLLTGAGYGLGNLSSPQAGETLFFFNYDWRKDLTEGAGADIGGSGQGMFMV